MSRKSFSAVAAGFGLLLIAGAGAAQADPSGAPTYRQLVGVGSDTTQSVVNGLANVVLDGSSTKLLGSYDAVGSQLITTKDAAVNNKCTFNRPVGSGNGRDALATSLPGATTTYANKDFAGVAAAKDITGCVDFARSSSYSSAVAAGSTANSHVLTFVPFATDAVTFATLATSNVPRKLTLANLKSIYQCTFGSPQSFKPLLPQAGSGTREFFLTTVLGGNGKQLIPAAGSGVGTGTSLGDCVKDTTPAGSQIVENDGTYLIDGDSLVPFSTGQFIAQISGQQTNSLGRAALGSIANANGKFASSLYINPSTNANALFPVTRDLFNVIPTSMVGDPTYSSVFVGGSSKVCTQPDIIQQFGFNVAANCGDTSKQSG